MRPNSFWDFDLEVVYELSISTKIGDREWPWTAKWPLFCVIFTELGSFRAHCVKVVYKAITMDNLRLLCLVVNVCRGTARRPRYKFLADSLIQDLMCSTCLAMVLIRSRIWAFAWYQNRWPCMTLNGEMALILPYFTEFGSGPYFALFHRIRVRCRRKTIVRLIPRFQNLLLIVYDHINTICAIIVIDYLGKTNSDNSVWWA